MATPALLSQVAAIAEALGRWSARQDALPSPRLRRDNRIHTIQASLAIEQNSLSLEQVTALFDGQRVIGPARDIQAVRNAIGRLWQTLILSRWNPLLAWLPIEEVIRSRQQGYYESLGQADQQGDLAPFMAYQLTAIEDALRSEIASEISSEMGSEIGAAPGAAIDKRILRNLAAEPTLSARRLAERLQLSQRAVENNLAALQRQGRLLRHGSPRAGYWQVL
jgi:Fic family protein